jgi:hypothetical protein
LRKKNNKLREIDPRTILDYIKSSIEILMNLKSEEQDNKLKKNKDTKNNRQKYGFDQDSSEVMSVTSQSLCSTLEKFKDGPPKEYEEAIQKLEGDVRMHIRVEQQMRLHIENLQQKIEDLEKENEHYIKKGKDESENLKNEQNKRLNELLNIKFEQMEQTKRKANDNALVNKYKEKIKLLEVHYETRIADLVEQLNYYRQQSNTKRSSKYER